MFQLRDYQTQTIEAVQAAWADGINRPAVVLPTGAGKTVCFSGLIAANIERLRAEGKRVLVLAHREELLDQAEAKIKAMIPDAWTCVLKGSRGQKKHQFADVIVASVQTLARPKRREAVDRIGMVIVDECHRYASRTYRDVLDHYGCMDERATPTVGFTATLTRMDGGLPDVWQSVAYSKKIHWMITQGYLIAPTAKSIDVGLNLATTRVTGGDLNTGDLANALDDSGAFATIAESWCEQASERPTIVFMPDVTTAEKMRDAFEVACGVKAEVVTGATGTQERRAIYGRFNEGTTRVLVSCMVLTEGFDAPQTSCVIIGRPTLNPGLYIQMVGRGLRLHPGKTDCLVLDIAGASLKHNLAGVNDLESDCEGRCDCNCLTCGCSDRCKCGIRQCGCACLELHEKVSPSCRCVGSDACGCGCEDPSMYGDDEASCGCLSDPACECRGEGPKVETKEVAIEVLKNLNEVDILGAELAQSGYTWLSTYEGIRFLPVGKDRKLFLIPAPEGGFFYGVVEGTSRNAPVTRLDDGAQEAPKAREAAEKYADASGYAYNSRKASWRRTQASEAQKGLLRRLKLEVPDALRKGDASDMLEVHRASATLDHRFGKYVKS